MHIGISDYFMNVDDDVSKRKYSRIVKKLAVNNFMSIDQFQYIKIQPNTIYHSTRLRGINPTNSLATPHSLLLRSIVLG